MKVIPLVEVNDTVLIASNILENDYPIYSGAATYAQDQRVISTATHSIYQSVAGGNVGNDPTLAQNRVSGDNQSGAWLYVSKTNKFRAFDGRNSARASNQNLITFDIRILKTSDVIAFMGLEALSVRVQVINSDLTVAYDETRILLDTSGITTFFAYFTFEADEFERNAIFEGLPAYPGTT